MAKYCTNCGKELDEKAALCLNCGVLVEDKATSNNQNKKKGLPTWAIVLIIVGSIFLLPIIFIVLIGVFTYNIVNNTISDIEEYIEEETTTQNGTIGDTLNTDDFNIRLIDAVTYKTIGTEENTQDIPSDGKEYLVFFFDVQNITNDNEYISEHDFTGYVDGYEVISSSLYNDVNNIKNLNTNLPPNRKTKGYVAFEVDSSWQEFEIRYINWLETQEIIFTIVNDKTENITGA